MPRVRGDSTVNTPRVGSDEAQELDEADAMEVQRRLQHERYLTKKGQTFGRSGSPLVRARRKPVDTLAQSLDAATKHPITRQLEYELDREFTIRQQRFAELMAEGVRTATACALAAGYQAAGSAAGTLTNPKKSPHVLALIGRFREERQFVYGVTLEGQLKRFHELSRGAEKAGQYSAAINAEKIRSALGGLTVDRREHVNTVNDMSREQVEARLSELLKKHPQALRLIDIPEAEVIQDNARPRSDFLEDPEDQDTQDDPHGAP